MTWTRTSDGVTLIGVALGLATAGSLLGFYTGVGGSGSWVAFFAAVGFGALLSAPAEGLDRHRLTVLVCLALAILATFVYLGLPSLLGAPDLYAGLPGFLGAERAFILTTCIATGLGLSALGLASYQVQDRPGRALVIAGVVVAVVVQVLLYFWLNAAVDSVAAQPPGPGYSFPWASLFYTEWGRLGALNAIPAGILTAAYERLYWRRHRLAFPKPQPVRA